MSEPLLMFTDDEKRLIWRTKANGCPDDDFELFLYMAQRTGLDPRANQLYIVKRGGKWTIQTGIDGYRLIADRTGKYAGSDDAEMIGETPDGKYPAAAKVTVFKMVDGQRCPFSATARWSEYYPGPGVGQQWHKMPCVMLAKVAEALALRKAFPADLSGIYTSEEMDQAGSSEVTEAPKAPVAPRPAPTATATPTSADAGGTSDEMPTAFGYRPVKWPNRTAFQEERTDPQKGKAHASWKERELDEAMYGATRKAVLKAFGFDGYEKKGHMMLWIDFLLNASSEAINSAIGAAHAAEGQEALL